MDVRAIILLGGVAESSNDAALETFNGTPLALQDVLGRSVLQRIVDRLVGYGAAAVTVIAAEESSPLFSLRAEQITINHLRPPASQYWRVAESSFCEFAQDGCEEVLLWRVGGYAEVDFDDLLQRHLDSRCQVRFGHAAALVTLLMLVSAVTLSFQLVCAKLVARNEIAEARAGIYSALLQRAWMMGLGLAACFVILSRPLICPWHACWDHVSSAINPAGQSLDIYLISASRRNEAAFLFRHQLRKFRTTCAPYRRTTAT